MSSLGPWGVSQLRNAVTGFFGNPYLRDYTHASKTFRPDSYALSPKLKFLFHVVFNINPEIYSHMNTSALILIIVTWSSVTFATAYFFYKILTIPSKPEHDSTIEKSEKE
jgi:hypothetical protein